MSRSRSGSLAWVTVTVAPVASIILTPMTVELIWPGPSFNDASFVPQQATDPAVALPISGVTAICRPRSRRNLFSSNIVTPAPTVTESATGSPICVNGGAFMCTSVPVVVKHGLSECSDPTARTGDGHGVACASLTMAMRSARLAGVSSRAGSHEAVEFQFVTVISDLLEEVLAPC